MSEKVKALIVTLDQDISEEKAQFIMKSFYAMRHVLDVSPVPADPIADWTVKVRLRNEIFDKLVAIVKDETS